MPQTITVTLSNRDLQVLEHEVANPELWLREALAGKIAAATARMVLDAKATLEADPAVDTMPTKPLPLLTMYVSRPDYKNRAARDLEESALRAKP